ncbi:MAG: glycosyltransferase family 4 protein [Planococcaceae bacterium]|nr:glycosyltransferase family 4 protein [Planococcaceae bacterium]
MKIAQVITTIDTLGGAQNHVRDLSKYLVENGMDVDIISGFDKYDVPKMKEVNYNYCPSLKREINLINDIKALLEVRRLLKEIKPDIVATHSSKAGLIGRLAAWSLRIPNVFTAHGWSFTEGVSSKKRKIYLVLEKVMAKITDCIITVSNYDKDLAIKNRVLHPGKVVTIHNGVIPFHDVMIRRIDESSFVDILMVARFDAPKKQLALIKACEKLVHLPWHLSFVGEGSKLNEVKQYVKSKEIDSRVYFYGSMNSVEEPLKKASIFALLSDYEGLPLSILEAMQAGLPVVASDVGGVREAVINSKNGFLIPKQDQRLLMYRLGQLITDARLREEMGLNGKALFAEKFTFERMLTQTFNIYKEVVDNYPKKGKTR